MIDLKQAVGGAGRPLAGRRITKTAKAADSVGDAAMVDADDLAQILGIEAGRQRRRADVGQDETK